MSWTLVQGSPNFGGTGEAYIAARFGVLNEDLLRVGVACWMEKATSRHPYTGTMGPLLALHYLLTASNSQSIFTERTTLVNILK